MGLFSSRWHEVFFSTSTESFFRGQNILREHGIPFRTKTVNSAFRVSRNNLSGSSFMLTRAHYQPENSDEHRIFVAEENTASARFLLQNNEMN